MASSGFSSDSPSISGSPSDSPNFSSLSSDEPSQQKRKTVGSNTNNVKVLNFSSNHNPIVKVQLLSTNTLHDLVDTICHHTSIGANGDEGVYDHMWTINFNGDTYESGEIQCCSPLRATEKQLGNDLYLGCVFKLMYDYGSQMDYKITFLGEEDMKAGDDKKLYPRRQPSSRPAGYLKYEINETNCPNNGDLQLDTLFRNLQRWIFKSHNAVLINLFQAGRKKNFGFFYKYGEARGMMYLPVKPANLTTWMTCFDRGATCIPTGLEPGGDGYPHYNWHSIVLLPTSRLTHKLAFEYEKNAEEGFCDVVRINDASSDPLTSAFPKITALAGLKKDNKVPKGWITFSKKGDKMDIAICSGDTIVPKGKVVVKGTAVVGSDQHFPVNEPLIQVSSNRAEIKGLHDLFCVVEGLLRTL